MIRSKNSGRKRRTEIQRYLQAPIKLFLNLHLLIKVPLANAILRL
jgi:hypothetical protein